MGIRYRYRTCFSDQEIVAALKVAGLDPDRLEPPNLGAFFRSLARPEQERLIEEAKEQKPS